MAQILCVLCGDEIIDGACDKLAHNACWDCENRCLEAKELITKLERPSVKDTEIDRQAMEAELLELEHKE